MIYEKNMHMLLNAPIYNLYTAYMKIQFKTGQCWMDNLLQLDQLSTRMHHQLGVCEQNWHSNWGHTATSLVVVILSFQRQHNDCQFFQHYQLCDQLDKVVPSCY